MVDPALVDFSLLVALLGIVVAESFLLYIQTCVDDPLQAIDDQHNIRLIVYDQILLFLHIFIFSYFGILPALFDVLSELLQCLLVFDDGGLPGADIQIAEVIKFEFIYRLVHRLIRLLPRPHERAHVRDVPCLRVLRVIHSLQQVA